MEHFLKKLLNYLKYLLTKRLLLLGDFNFHINKNNDPNVIKFGKLLEEFSLQLHVTSPTCKSFNTLDLVMTRSSDDILLAKPKVKAFISDHAAIMCHLRSFKPNRSPQSSAK